MLELSNLWFVGSQEQNLQCDQRFMAHLGCGLEDLGLRRRDQAQATRASDAIVPGASSL